MSLGRFLRVGQYGPASHFGHDQMRSAFASRAALLQVPSVLVGHWFRFGIFGIPMEMDVNQVLALLEIACVAEVDWEARPDVDSFSTLLVR